ncbi:MAG: hypothetical protein ACFFCW_36045, partial [Candidatus Hodarchaeota archaeon]
ILVLIAGCAHTPHPYQTESYKQDDPILLRTLTHTDAPPMPDTLEFWVKPEPIAWWGPFAFVGVVFLQGMPLWLLLLMWAYAP